MDDLLTSAFSRSAVMVLADPASYLRGVAYAGDGRAERADATADRIEGTVRGSMPYHVALWLDDGGQPAWSCTCPVGEDGRFCKHCVALALCDEIDLDDEGDWEDEPSRSASDEETLRAYLRSQDHKRLVDLLLGQAGADWRLRERLLAEAAAAGGTGVDVGVWRDRLEVAFSGDDFVDYAEAASWAHGVQQAIEAVAELVDLGHAGAVVVLAEHAHRLADEAIQYVDDSDGWLTGISSDLGELHLRACEAAGEDPVALARRLVDLELSSELEAFYRAAAHYAAVLGEAGLAEYRRLVSPRFEALEAGEGRSDAFRVTQAMIGVALASGDPEQLVAVKSSAGLRVPGDYCEIAKAFARAGRDEEAVDWAERGLAAFPDRPWQTPPLRELLAESHRRGGRAADAVDVFWSGLARAPSLQSYRRLLDEVKTVGFDPGVWRDKALEHLRGDRQPASTLIEVLLYEGLADEAWSVACARGCDQRQWMTLARARERTHPADAIPVYEREVAALLQPVKSKLYPSAVDLMARIERLYKAQARPDGFAAYVARVRAEHGRKSSLMGLMARKRW
ncbi:MAG: SWIM zinc finger family protein [Egibacteraceae bacterium]